MESITYILRISYDGTNYFGWQKQPNVLTVQTVLEEALNKLFGTSIKTAGASRTDCGVHAEEQVVSFAAQRRYEPDDLPHRLNKMLPDDISVIRADVTDKKFSARFDSKAKIYRYEILLTKNPLRMRYGWWCRKLSENSLPILNDAASLIIGTHDFSAFSILQDLPEEPLCNIIRAEWKLVDSNASHFFIEGNRFLHKMVRSLVGAMIDIATGHISIDDFKTMLDEGRRVREFRNAPANGLTLVKVRY